MGFPVKRWCRFSLRTFLVIVALCAAWLALKVNHARIQREVAEKITALGGEVRFLRQLNPRVYPNEEIRMEPAWLRKLVGDEYFITVALASIQGQEVTDDDVKELARVNTFRKLSFCDSLVSDEGLKHLRVCVTCVGCDWMVRG